MVVQPLSKKWCAPLERIACKLRRVAAVRIVASGEQTHSNALLEPRVCTKHTARTRGSSRTLCAGHCNFSPYQSAALLEP
eukprot:10986906-Alexandrium_andersonii.AAC.1